MVVLVQPRITASIQVLQPSSTNRTSSSPSYLSKSHSCCRILFFRIHLMSPRHCTSHQGEHSPLLCTAICWRCIVACWFEHCGQTLVCWYGDCIHSVDQAWIYRLTGGVVFINGWWRVIYTSDRDPIKLSNTLNKEIQGAVLKLFIESLCRRTRRRNVVISGLPSRPGASDTTLVDELLAIEFGYKPLIARTRRLGRVVSGRVEVEIKLGKWSQFALNDPTLPGGASTLYPTWW